MNQGLLRTLCGTLIVAGLVATINRRLPTPYAAAQGNDQGTLKFVGAETCKQCHEKPGNPNDFVLLTEYATWKEEDKHSKAYEMLKSPRGREIGKRLNVDVLEEKPSNACLNCHAVNVPAARRYDDRFRLTDGVTCDACHGPAEKWLLAHFNPGWRVKPAEEKSKQGMLDIRDPVKKAEMCLSCHVGNAAENKVLTHAMYAAGHPPLPAFELETFCENLPRHWRPLKDKPAEIRKLLKFDPASQERTKNVVIGGVAVLRESMRLLAEQAGRGSIDFAQYDCAACHHELQADSWRQRRGYAGVPGRPPPAEWPAALIDLGIRAADPGLERELRQRLARLQSAFDRRPFGDPAAIAAEARDLAGLADQLLAKLRPLKITKAESQRLAAGLLEQGRAADYDSAWQRTFALEQILSELQPTPSPELRKLLEQLRADLHLKLPSGKSGDIMTNLPARLEAMGKYDPEVLRRRFGELRPLLKGE